MQAVPLPAIGKLAAASAIKSQYFHSINRSQQNRKLRGQAFKQGQLAKITNIETVQLCNDQDGNDITSSGMHHLVEANWPLLEHFILGFD